MSNNAPFSAEVYSARVQRAQQLLNDADVNVAVLGTGADFAYLTGSWISSHERLTALLVTPEAAHVIAPATDILELESSPVAEMDIEVHGWQDGDNPYQLMTEVLGKKPQKFALGASLTADHVLRMLDEWAGAEFLAAPEVLGTLLYAKDDKEIEQLRLAGQAIDRVHAAVPELLRAGRTEAEVAAELTELILREHDFVDFVIVGSGPNGANPHHDYSDRVMEEGEPVVVDIGGTLPSGYHSDCTRTYVVGGDITKAPEDFQKAYEVLEAAQRAGREASHKGFTAAEVDAAVREPIAEAGWGEYYVHRTGHGIGLSTHEEPFIMAGNDLDIEPGMAFSIEPGIYLTGQWGMRLEDIVVAGETECESLNNGPREVR